MAYFYVAAAYIVSSSESIAELTSRHTHSGGCTHIHLHIYLLLLFHKEKNAPSTDYKTFAKEFLMRDMSYFYTALFELEYQHYLVHGAVYRMGVALWRWRMCWVLGMHTTHAE